MDSNHHIMMAAYQELQNALQLKKVNQEMFQLLMSSLQWLLHYEKKYRMQLPERDKIENILDMILAVNSKTPITRISAEKLQQDKINQSDEDVPVPYVGDSSTSVYQNRKKNF